MTFSVFTGNCLAALSMHRISDKVFMMYSRLAGLETLDNAMPKFLMNPPDYTSTMHSVRIRIGSTVHFTDGS